MNIRIWKPKDKGNPCPGRFYYQFFLKKKRHRGSLEARTLEQATEAAHKVWDEKWSKKYVIEEKPVTLFKNFVKDSYLPWSKTMKASYADDVRITTMLSDFFKDKTLAEISPAMIEQFKADRVGKEKAPATVNRELSVLSKVFTLAVRLHEADSNPCKNVERFPLDNQRERYLTVEEEEKLFDAIGDNDLLRSVVTVALHTGMRRGEIFNLRWEDVDFQRGTLQLRKTKTKLNRTLPMNSIVREVISSQKRSGEYIFASPRTKSRLVDIKKGFNEARLAAGIPDFQLRDLRHSCATRLSDCGEELVTVAEILGHTDVRMTKRYSHAIHERKRQALEKLVATSSTRQKQNGRAVLPAVSV